jgi:hypothetical protein
MIPIEQNSGTQPVPLSGRSIFGVRVEPRPQTNWHLARLMNLRSDPNQL